MSRYLLNEERKNTTRKKLVTFTKGKEEKKRNRMWGKQHKIKW